MNNSQLIKWTIAPILRSRKSFAPKVTFPSNENVLSSRYSTAAAVAAVRLNRYCKEYGKSWSSLKKYFVFIQSWHFSCYTLSFNGASTWRKKKNRKKENCPKAPCKSRPYNRGMKFGYNNSCMECVEFRSSSRSFYTFDCWLIEWNFPKQRS